MLFRKFDFEDKEAKKKFQFDKENHLSTWEHYSVCYNYTIEKIFSKGLQRNYAFNCRARGILFLIRHNLELCVKHNLELNGYAIPLSHSFEDLLPEFEDEKIIPKGFREVIDKINYDSEGTCYRYYKDKNTGKPFFKFDDQIKLADLLKDYNKIPSSETFRKGNICEPFDYENRRIKWDLTFHMGECNGLGHIRTQYDEVIEFLVEGVLFEEYDINRVYLPLLFLIRHSLEIALKFNIQEARKIFSLVTSENLDTIHSLRDLYNYFGGKNGYLSKIDTEKMSLESKWQYDDYKEQYEQLNETIHKLDTNSHFFRFPVDKKGKTHSLNMKVGDLYKILRLYYLTDPFITFTNGVLEEEGII